MVGSDAFTWTPIGIVRSPYKQKFGTPRQSGLVPEAQGVIELNPHHVPQGALEGLEGFSHLWLFFHFHQNNQARRNGKVRPPRLQGETMGVFATRTPHRPNPMGMSLLKIERVDPIELKIFVNGVDIVDGTPIIDIKPYIPSYDSSPIATEGWLQELHEKVYPVVWVQNPESLLEPQTKSLIEKTLRFDLRNLEDRKKTDHNKVFKTLIEDWDIHYRWTDDNVEIIGVHKMSQ
ncbi:MAG: tRNA (N6-threonylcarbamoyladenosine(37)-N6)-methyltransferase TrmO [Pseudomonadota bacterium]